MTANATRTHAPPCPLWLRLTALVYDLLIVLAIMLGAVMLGLLLTGGQLLDQHQSLQAHWFPWFEAALVASYFVASWLRGGQTIGMRPWRLRITAANGGKPSWRQALIRLSVAAAPLLLLGLAPWLGMRMALGAVLLGWSAWFAVALVDPRRRALHDLAAGTEMRRIG